MKPPRTYPIPNLTETRKILNIKVTKSAKYKGRCAIEGIKSKLQEALDSTRANRATGISPMGTSPIPE